MGYTAEAIGNHDFDFGSVDSPAARQLPGDPRGALKARAAQARYPFLAANLIDEATGRPVEWPNVRPSVVVGGGRDQGRHHRRHDDRRVAVDPRRQRSGTADRAARRRRSPRRPSKLRAAGAEVVIVAAHAGGRCERFDQPADLSSCEPESEIFRVARSLPHGSGGRHRRRPHARRARASGQRHRHHPAASRAARRSAASTSSFDRRTRRVARIQLFAPQQIVPARRTEGKGRQRAIAAIVEAMAPALQRVHELQATPLGVSLELPIRARRRASDRRWETSLPKRSAPRCPARTSRQSTTRRAVCGRICRKARSRSGGSTTCSRSTTASRGSRERRRARSLAGRRDRPGPPRLAGYFRRRGAGELSWPDGLHVDLFRGRDAIRDEIGWSR